MKDTDMTIYHYCDMDEQYYRTHIHDVDWYGTQAVTVGDKGLRTANTYTLRIPEQSNLYKEYVHHKMFDRSESWQKAQRWTLKEGDRIVKGMVYDDIQSPKDFLKYAECVTVFGITDNRRGSPAMRHLKVLCG